MLRRYKRPRGIRATSIAYGHDDPKHRTCKVGNHRKVHLRKQCVIRRLHNKHCGHQDKFKITNQSNAIRLTYQKEPAYTRTRTMLFARFRISYKSDSTTRYISELQKGPCGHEDPKLMTLRSNIRSKILPRSPRKLTYLI